MLGLFRRRARIASGPSHHRSRPSASALAASRALVATSLIIPVLVSSTSAFGAAPRKATAGADRAQIAQLEQRISQQADATESLVERFNLVSHQLDVLKSKISTSESQLHAEQKAQNAARVRLGRTAVNAYVNAATGSSPFIGVNTGSSFQVEQQVYLGAAGGDLSTAIGSLQFAQHETSSTAASLRVEELSADQTLTQLTAARSAAQSAISTDDAILGHVSANLQALVTQATLQREQAAEEAEEQELAAEAAQQRAAAASAPAPVTVQSASGQYSNPLRSMSGLVSERIDQGVDFGGFGPIYAIGNGVVISTYDGGWPGGTFISYELTNGPANGLVVYVAENLEPRVSVGQTVTSNTVLGEVYEGYAGIETGWANHAGDGVTMAAAYGQYGGGGSTAFGANFSELLQSLGAPGGVLQNNPPIGALPGGWPSW